MTLRASAEGLGPDQDRVTYKYRLGTQGTFQSIPDGSTGQLKDGNGDTVTQPSMISAGTFAPWTWNVAATVAAAGGSTASVSMVQVEACYGNAAGTQWCPTPWNILLTPSTASEATTPVGPGVLSLDSGDYNLSSTDASLTTSLGSISIGRTLDTLHPAGDDSSATGVFGPGWRADLAGPDAGEGDLTPADHHTDGYLVFTDEVGTPTVFEATTPTTTFPISFVAIGDDASDGITLTMNSATKITWVDPDQTKTIWTYANSVWQAVVQQSGANPASTTTKYTYNSAGLVTRILAPTPAGMTTTCTDANADTTPGCRSLVLKYGEAKCNSTNPHRLCEIYASIPTTSGTTNLTLIRMYIYNVSGQLAASYDPRLNPLNYSTYDYDGSGRLTWLCPFAPSGSHPWTFSYDGSGRLSKINHTVPVTDPATGTTSDQTATDTIVYDVPLSGTLMPDVRADTAQSWNETTDLPVIGTAVFPPDHQPSDTDPDHVGSADWAYATIHYLDANDREVNTASYGAEQWLIDTTQYDTNGNDVWDLDAGNRAQALNPTSDTDPYVAAKSNTATRADLLASTTAYNPLDPSEATDTYGPTHPVTLNSGSVIDARAHVATTYDEGAPYNDVNPATAAPYRLPTTVTSSFYDVSTGGVAGSSSDQRSDTSGYAAVGTMVGHTMKNPDGTTLTDPSGSAVPLTGWALAEPTTTKVAANTAGLTTTYVYDQDGRVVSTRLPGDNGGTTPRTTNTTYYTATGSGSCAKPSIAGLVCQTAPGGQPSRGALLPTTTVTYDQWGDPLTTTEAGSGLRVVTNTYDKAGRLRSTVTTASGASDNAALPEVDVDYDWATAQVADKTTTTGASTTTLSTTYNSSGDVATYTDATGNTTTTGYDIDGRPVWQKDDKGTIKLTYDGGTGEHRGVVTREDIGTSANSTFTATYDADGSPTQTYPGGLTASGSYDNAGNQTGLSYTKAGNTLMAFTQTIGDQNTGTDHIVAQTSKVNGTTYSSQTFADDAYGRLTTVQDTYNGACTTRNYTYNNDSDRGWLISYPATSTGACSTSTSPTITTYEHDTADRLIDDTTYDATGNTTNTYSYDVFGRTSTLPAGDATGIGSHNSANGGPTGAVTLGYYTNDMVASQAQGSGTSATTIDFGLDPDQNRISTEATTTSAGTKTVTNHYDDESDSPAWTSTHKVDGTTVVKRYLDGIDGNLDAFVNDNGDVKLELTNLHGDTVATVDPDATSIAGYQETTEFGIPRDPASADDNYGWLGAKKRSTDDLGGLTLMGVRLYNPATGRFLSVDAVPGGNPNAYTYPVDPINGFDTDGRFPHWIKAAAKHLANAVADHKDAIMAGTFGACIFVSEGLCLGVTVGLSAVTNAIATVESKQSRGEGVKNFAVDTVLGTVNFHLAKNIEASAKALNMTKGQWRTIDGSSKIANGTVAAGTVVLKNKKRKQIFRGCRKVARKSLGLASC